MLDLIKMLVVMMRALGLSLAVATHPRSLPHARQLDDGEGVLDCFSTFEKLALSSQLLVLVRPSPDCFGHLGHETVPWNSLSLK